MTDHHDNPETDQQPHSDNKAVYQTSFDPETDAVSETLVEAIATINDADPEELAILADVVDPDALDALFQPRPDGTKRATNGQVSFRYNEYPVRVQIDGTITLLEPDASSER